MTPPSHPDGPKKPIASLSGAKILSVEADSSSAAWKDGIDLGPDTEAFKLPKPPRRPLRTPDDETKRTTRSSSSLPVSSFLGDGEIDLNQPRTGRWVWLRLGVLMSLMAQGAAWWFFHGTDTFGGALLFAVAGLAGFIFPLFQRNAKELWSGRLGPWEANGLLLLDLLVLFLGLVAGFLILPLVLGADTYGQLFSGIARFVDVRRASLGNFAFSGTLDIILVNLRVAMVFFLIGLFFRYVGTLIVLVWNASTWGVVFAASISGGLAGGKATLLDGVRLGVVVMPHLVIETGAYLCAAMGGIFLSRALGRYRLMSDRFEQVGRSVLILVAVAMVMVILAAMLEGLWGRWLARQWFAGLEVMD